MAKVADFRYNFPEEQGSGPETGSLQAGWCTTLLLIPEIGSAKAKNPAELRGFLLGALQRRLRQPAGPRAWRAVGRRPMDFPFRRRARAATVVFADRRARFRQAIKPGEAAEAPAMAPCIVEQHIEAKCAVRNVALDNDHARATVALHIKGTRRQRKHASDNRHPGRR